jgi:hypothetical protein
MRALTTLLVSCTALLVSYSSADSASHDAFEEGWTHYEQGDYTGAMALWLPLAEQGYVNAQINLAALYEQGNGVERDLERAAAWYRAAARQDSAIGQYNLGLFLTEHDSDGVDTERALHWLGRAAEQGFADAQLQIGLMCARGVAGAGRLAEAVHWLYQAGLGYLSADDAAGAAAAAAALRDTASGAPLAVDLEARLARHGGSASQPGRVAAGTAWPVRGGYVVTSLHIVAGKHTLLLTDSHGRTSPATLVASDEANDVALLAVVDPQLLPPPLPLAGEYARLGATVFTIGFPRVDVMGNAPKVSLGIVSGVSGMYDDPASYQISLPIQPGNSGGPLLNMRGEVVGLVSAMLGRIVSASGEPEPFANIGYALKIDRVATLLEATREPPNAGGATPADAQTLEELAQRVQASVLILRAL